MTISTTASTVVIAGNGSTVSFNFSFVAGAASNIVVTYTDASSNATVLVQGTQYTLALNPPSAGQIWGVGGTVTYPLSGSPIASGSYLTISRVVSDTQLTSISNQGDFYPQAVEKAMDTLEMQIQQNAAGVARAIQVNPADTTPPLPLPIAAVRANQLMGFDSLGNPIAAQPASALVSTAMQPVVDAATTSLATNLLTYLAAGAGAVARSVAAKLGDVLSIKDFGAKCDGVTDDTAAWNACLTAARASNSVVFHPGGKSIYTGNLALVNDAIFGVGSYYAPPGGAITQTSLIEFHGNNAGLTLRDANSGGLTLEKIGFAGVPGAYTGQTGLLMSDALRPSGQNEGWPTLRDVLFANFTNGVMVGNTYQTGFMFNVLIYNSAAIGYQQSGADWYHHQVACGNGGTIASTAQLIVGAISGSALAASSGTHQFVGCEFFGANNTVVIQNSASNTFTSCYFQNANQNGVLIGNNTTLASSNTFLTCTFSGNNQSGGARNANGYSYYDVNLTGIGADDNEFIGCEFALAGSNAACIAAGIYLAYGADGTVVQGCRFNMDLIVTPGLPGAPLAVQCAPQLLANTLDHQLISGNLRQYGRQGILTYGFLPLDMAALIDPYVSTASGTSISISAGVAVLSPPTGTLAFGLANPGYSGRPLFITSESGAGNTVTCTTSGALTGGKTTMSFASPAWIQLISNTATGWQILGSSGVTLT